MPRPNSADSHYAQGASSAYNGHIPSSQSAMSHSSTTPLTNSNNGGIDSQGPRRRTQGGGILTALGNRFSRAEVDANSSNGQPDYNQVDDYLPPPNLPFVPHDSNPNFGPSSRRDSTNSLAGSFVSKTSDSKPSNRKSTYYLPTKMSNLHVPGEHAHRRPAKRGGGAGAWDMSGHNRMGGEDEDDELDHAAGMTAGGARPSARKAVKKKLIWNRFKWVLFIANLIFLAYSLGILIVTLLVWFDVFTYSDVLRVGNRTELILSTTAGALCLLTALMGFAGILLNNRTFLGFYTLFLWFCFALIVAPGYITYKKKAFNLEGKINSQWSRSLELEGRLRIQNQLNCCGYYSPFVEAVASNTCYPRSILPGCKSKYLKFERRALQAWYTASFAIVPAQILMIVAGLLCSNHVTYRLGKGLTPPQYRLDETSTAQLLNQYAAEIAAQYPSLAQEALQRSHSGTLLSEKFAAHPSGHANVKSSRTSSFSSLR